jgi:hypothetical protein
MPQVRADSAVPTKVTGRAVLMIGAAMNLACTASGRQSSENCLTSPAKAHLDHLGT